MYVARNTEWTAGCMGAARHSGARSCRAAQHSLAQHSTAPAKLCQEHQCAFGAHGACSECGTQGVLAARTAAGVRGGGVQAVDCVQEQDGRGVEVEVEGNACAVVGGGV
jgi:hypothetical protein